MPPADPIPALGPPSLETTCFPKYVSLNPPMGLRNATWFDSQPATVLPLNCNILEAHASTKQRVGVLLRWHVIVIY